MDEGINRTIVQQRFGVGANAVDLVEEPIPVPGEGELLVELVIAPINPAELLMFEGKYGLRETRPSLPRGAGIEGVGRVVGGDTSLIKAGTLVSLAGTPSVFSDFRLMAAKRVIVLNPDVDPEAFAVSFVNVQSILFMLHEWDELQPGDWIIQNAANSAYGRLLDAVANRRGLSTINVVRSDASAQRIAGSARGAVLVDGDGLEESVLSLTGGVRPKVGVDAIGGESSGRLASVLAPGGRLVTYGLLSGEDMRVDPRTVVFGGVRVEGFWMPRAMAEGSAELRANVRNEAIHIIEQEAISVPVQSRFSLSDYAQAFKAASDENRDGKVALTR